MPTTKEECKYIAKILDDVLFEWDHITDSQANFIKRALTQNLAEKIGYITKNYSVRASLINLCKHYNKDWNMDKAVVENLVNEWHDNPENQRLTVQEYVGMNDEDWDKYIDGKFQVY